MGVHKDPVPLLYDPEGEFILLYHPVVGMQQFYNKI